MVTTRLETARLVIRTFESRDAQAWVAMVNDPEVVRFLPPGPAPTMETFAEVMERRHAMEREIGYAMWAVDDKATGTFVGQCGIRTQEGMNGQPAPACSVVITASGGASRLICPASSLAWSSLLAPAIRSFQRRATDWPWSSSLRASATAW